MVFPPVRAPNHAEVLIARQPIFDGDLNLHGYELLYRSLDRSAGQDADVASGEMITVGFMDIGLSTLVENKLVYLKVSAEFLACTEATIQALLSQSGCFPDWTPWSINRWPKRSANCRSLMS
ncbi:MAG: hypothetical protein ACI8W7_001138 [Gammaproteobacteria bacterium]